MLVEDSELKVFNKVARDLKLKEEKVKLFE